jgi:prepilin-type N-terminal cleavage/methylation domain-containing protein
MKNQKGFTLIEMMIVIAIIGILTAITISTQSNNDGKNYTVDCISGFEWITSYETKHKWEVQSRDQVLGVDGKPKQCNSITKGTMQIETN